MKKVMIQLIVIVAIISFNGMAGAITYEMSWTGNAGYSMYGTFSFDETTAGTEFTESNFGPGSSPTTTLENLSVSFYDPSNSLLDSYDIVVSNISNPFLYLNFNVTDEVFIIPDFLIAGPDPEHDWLLGSEVDEETGRMILTLTEAFGTGIDSRDKGDPIVSVSRITPVPEPATLILFGTGLIGFAGFRRKFKK